MVEFVPWRFDISDIVWTSAIRAPQAFLGACPTLLVGLAAAGMMRGMVGGPGLRRLMGVGSRTGLLRAWLLSLCIPTCSLGALPVAAELRRAGVPRSTVLMFLLHPSLFHPLFFAYGLTLREPAHFLAFFVGAALTAAGVALAVDRAAGPEVPPAETSPELPASGPARLGAAALAAARAAAGPVWVFALAAFAATGLVAGLLPFAAPDAAIGHPYGWALPSSLDPMPSPNLIAPLQAVLMMAAGYVPPAGALMQVGSLSDCGHSLGSAFAVLMFGAAFHLGTAAWVAVVYGRRAPVVLVAALAALTLGFGYAADAVLYRPVAADDTHALDDRTQPVGLALPNAKNGSWAVSKISAATTGLERGAAVALLLLTAAGVAVRRTAAPPAPEPPAAPQPGTVPLWNRPVGRPALAGAAVVVVAGLAAVAAFVVYPAPESLFADMRESEGDAFAALNSAERHTALSAVRRWRNFNRKLPTSVLLRRVPADADLGGQVAELDGRLADLEHLVDAGRLDEARIVMTGVQAAFRSTCEAVHTSARR